MNLPAIKKEAKKIPEKLLTIDALIIYLTKLNNSTMVYVKKIYTDSKGGNKIYEMSNGLSYTKNADGEWQII